MGRPRPALLPNRALKPIVHRRRELFETDATPAEVVSWFQSDLCRDDVLLLWVSGERGHSLVLQELLNETPAIDTVLQDEVAFLFTAPESRSVAIRPASLPSAPFFRRLSHSHRAREPDGVSDVARATMQAAGDFAAAFELTLKEIPSLIILVKHLDRHMTAPMGLHVSLANIRPWLAEIVASVRRHRERCEALTFEEFTGARFPIQMILDADQMLTAQRRKFRRTLDGLIGRHPDVGRLGASLVKLVTAEADFDVGKARQALVGLMQEAEWGNAHRLLGDGRLAKLERLLRHIEASEDEIRSQIRKRQTIEGEHVRYRRSLEELEVDIENTCQNLAGSRMASVGSLAGRVLKVAPNVLDRASRIAEALGKLSERLPPSSGTM